MSIVSAPRVRSSSSPLSEEPHNDDNNNNNNYFTAIARKDAELIRTLRKQGGNINVKSTFPQDFHRTPLHLCVYDNYIEGAKILIDGGADVNALDDLQDSPFLLTCAEGREEILKLMLQTSESVKKFGSATSRRLKTAVPDTTLHNRQGDSALHLGAERGHLPIVKLLLTQKEKLKESIDVNAYNNARLTPLLSVLELGGDDRLHVEIVKLLIQHGADVQLPDAEGHTPLSLAKEYKFSRMVQLLEDAGATE
ncbi:ankyrin [Angomonas deanei]|nr:ankyrin [Angomonas deanei]EPY41942.1 ankyrindomain protein [Angomonas deanei]EPY43625.1 ankyrin [Angomonas deanei]|eukprot:EPY26841.1 ankyrin [Angomonas deanei]